MTDFRRDFLKKLLLAGLVSPSSFVSLSREHIPLNQEPDGLFDWESLSKRFLIKENYNYFNTAAVGPSFSSVINSVNEWMNRLNTNGESGHSHLAGLRSTAASLLNTNSSNIGFCRNTTEGINIVSQVLPLKNGDEILISNHEHVGGASPWYNLQRIKGVSVKVVELDESGEENTERILYAISGKTKVVAISHVTCTTGMMLDVKEICRSCRERQIYSSIDGAQAMGMINVDLDDLRPDFYIGSGHKWLFGPKGTGIFYAAKENQALLKNSYIGAHSLKKFNVYDRELSFKGDTSIIEYGTRNIPILMGLQSAIEIIIETGVDKIYERGRELTNYLREKLSRIKNVEILSPTQSKYATSILTFRVAGQDNKRLTAILKMKYKCRVRYIYESDLDGIRVSCSIINTHKNLDKLAEAVEEIA